ncbi:MAG: hypothetical protein AAGG68_12140 [Bacteroidota bacterium]
MPIKNFMLKSVLFFLLFFLAYSVSAQNKGTITLYNPSFEGTAAPFTSPKGWYDCGFEGENINILHSGNSPFTGIRQQAFVGNTYLGLVVRENNTWEAVGQNLKRAMQIGKCYEFHLKLCKSEHFFSRNKEEEKVDYNGTAKIKIWGSNDFCLREELLAETSSIDHYNWKDYVFVLSPQSSDITHLRIESYHLEDSLYAYNGNVLIDHATPLIAIDCEDKKAVELQTKTFLPENWYSVHLSFDARLAIAKQKWKSQLVANTYSEATPYKHKVRIRLSYFDDLDDAIIKFAAALKVPVDLSKDGFIITLVSGSLKEKKSTYPLLRQALEEMGVPWEQYRILSEIEKDKKFRTYSGKKHLLYLELEEKESLERFIIKLEEEIRQESADPLKDSFTLDVKAKPKEQKAIRKKLVKALKILEISPSQYKIRFE